MNTHYLDLLTKNILWQAEFYLNECDEFFPFGCSINVNGELSPFSVYMENEHHNSVDVINELEIAIQSQIGAKAYKIAAVGIDVYLNLPNNTDKVTAIQIRFFPSGISEEKFFKYHKQDGKYLIEPI